MFANLVTVEEFYRLGTDKAKRLVSEDDAAAALTAATHLVQMDLRSRHYDLSKVQLPKMFDGIMHGQTVSYGNRTSDYVISNGEARLVIDYKSSSPAVFTLEGSHDGVYWVDVYDPYTTDPDKAVRITCTEAKRYSVAFSEQYTYYRYVLSEADSSVTYSAYLVDTVLDMLFIYRAVMVNLQSRLSDNDDMITAIYNEYRRMYSEYIAGMVVSYDSDGDGIPDVNSMSRNIAWR